ncbi:hypothetical protein MRB53_028482 [Persea americana]|uniref:Uncharacterized protein n=1 Tax=Persea americana TaxID=3435 RepID=A0ACC2KG48_PERAE|nr:hypothetical protein MRB53_028482 [Persea americana]
MWTLFFFPLLESRGGPPLILKPASCCGPAANGQRSPCPPLLSPLNQAAASFPLQQSLCYFWRRAAPASYPLPSHLHNTLQRPEFSNFAQRLLTKIFSAQQLHLLPTAKDLIQRPGSH